MKQNASLTSIVRLAAVLSVVPLAWDASAQNQIFFENFDTDHSSDGTWVTNSTSVRDVNGVITSGGFNPVNLYFDFPDPGDNHGAEGGNIVFGDGHAEWVPRKRYVGSFIRGTDEVHALAATQ
jgi:prepilin-type processing-associated H-X9-DG protein